MPKRPSTCPECGSARVARIAYGYPGPEMVRDAERGKIVLGGCIVMPDNPTWSCLECHAQWGRPAGNEKA